MARLQRIESLKAILELVPKDRRLEELIYPINHPFMHSLYQDWKLLALSGMVGWIMSAFILYVYCGALSESEPGQFHGHPCETMQSATQYLHAFFSAAILGGRSDGNNSFITPRF